MSTVKLRPFRERRFDKLFGNKLDKKEIESLTKTVRGRKLTKEQKRNKFELTKEHLKKLIGKTYRGRYLRRGYRRYHARKDMTDKLKKEAKKERAKTTKILINALHRILLEKPTLDTIDKLIDAIKGVKRAEHPERRREARVIEEAIGFDPAQSQSLSNIEESLTGEESAGMRELEKYLAEGEEEQLSPETLAKIERNKLRFTEDALLIKSAHRAELREYDKKTYELVEQNLEKAAKYIEQGQKVRRKRELEHVYRLRKGEKSEYLSKTDSEEEEKETAVSSANRQRSAKEVFKETPKPSKKGLEKGSLKAKESGQKGAVTRYKKTINKIEEDTKERGASESELKRLAKALSGIIKNKGDPSYVQLHGAIYQQLGGKFEDIEEEIEGEGHHESMYNDEMALSDKEIDQIMSYNDNYIGTCALDEVDDILDKVKKLKRTKFSFIINNRTRDEFEEDHEMVGHWLAVWCDTEEGDFCIFDPLAEIDEETIDEIAIPFKDYFDKTQNHYLKLKVNKIPEQAANSHACGWFCVRFIHMMDQGLPFKVATGYTNIKENEEDVKEMKQRYEKFLYI